MDNIYVASPLTAIAVSTLVQLMKRSKFLPGVTADSAKVNVTVSALLALLSAIGLVFSFDFNPDTGHFAAGITGNMWDVLHVITHTPIQFLQQHAFYQGAIRPAELLERICAELQKKE